MFELLLEGDALCLWRIGAGEHLVRRVVGDRETAQGLVVLEQPLAGGDGFRGGAFQIDRLPFLEIVGDVEESPVAVEPPSERSAGILVKSVDELLECLRTQSVL